MTKFLGPFVNRDADSPNNLEEYKNWVNLDGVVTTASSATSNGPYFYSLSLGNQDIYAKIFEFYGPNAGDDTLDGVDYNYLRFLNANFIDAINSSPEDVVIEPTYPTGFPTRNIYTYLDSL